MAVPTHAMRFAMFSVLAVLAGAAIASACGSSSKSASNSNATQSSVDALTARVQRDEMVTAWLTIESLPVHDLDTTLQGGKIDGKYVPTLRTLIRVLAITDWPGDLKPMMQTFQDDATALYKAMNSGQEASALKDMSTTVHEHWHMFGPAVGNLIAKDLPADAGGPEPTQMPSTATAGSATPMPAMTP